MSDPNLTMMWLVHLCSHSGLATMCLGLVALLGDWIVTHDAVSWDLRAVFDNMTHGAIGLLTWSIVSTYVSCLPLAKCLWEVALCGVLACLIDLDHFVAAKSFKIQSARNLSSRPALHCTSATLIVCALCLMLTHVFQWHSLHRCFWILIAAILSHHLRDATRRGFWLYPLGSTPPVPYAVYLVSCMVLPHALAWLIKCIQTSHRHISPDTVITV